MFKKLLVTQTHTDFRSIVVIMKCKPPYGLIEKVVGGSDDGSGTRNLKAPWSNGSSNE